MPDNKQKEVKNESSLAEDKDQDGQNLEVKADKEDISTEDKLKDTEDKLLRSLA